MNAFLSNRIAVLLALFGLGLGCLLVIWPFLTSLAWAVILVTSTWGIFKRLDQALGNHRLVTAVLMTLLVTVVLLGPISAVAIALSGNISDLNTNIMAAFQDGLPERVLEWAGAIPIVGGELEKYLQQFVHDKSRLTTELQKLAAPLQVFALASGRVALQGVLDMALSVFLTFFFFYHGSALSKKLSVVAKRLSGERGESLITVAGETIHGVIYGVLGTALAQGVLASIGFAIAGMQSSILLGLITFFLSVVPIGPPLVWGGVALWLFQQDQMGWAIFVLAWGFLVVSTVDNIIKPFIISRGSRLPFVVVFLGVLGGVIAFGVIGAFLGPVLLAVTYQLVIEWTSDTTAK
ncbi:MAG: AI-2E family transporter [Polynucleobacter sp.]|nr:AI-2E family transporter [Polynucleobacter sp.]